MKVALGLVGWWRLQHVAEKHCVVRYHQFSAVQTIENLNPVVVSQADLDDSLYKMAAIGCHPSRHRAIGFADHAIRGYSDRFHRFVDLNDEVSKHSGAQFIFGVRDLRTDRHSMSVRINRLVDFRDLSLEYAVGIGHHLDCDWLPYTEKRTFTFGHICQHPLDSHVSNRIRCRRISWLYEKSGLGDLVCDLARNWTTYDQGGINLARGDHLINFGIRLTKDEDRIPCGFESTLGRLLIRSRLLLLALGNSAKTLDARQFFICQFESRRRAN